MTTYQPRPTEDPGPPQWSAEDLRLATERGQHNEINAAMASGQLRDLMTRGDGNPHGAPSRVAGPMNFAQAAEYLRVHVPPQGASEGTIRAYTEEIA